MAYSTSEVARTLGISRNTLLRWFREGRVPDGPRDRNGWRVFGEADVEALRAYAAGPSKAAAPDERLGKMCAYLAQVPMFQGLPRSALEALAGTARFLGVPSGQRIFSQGDTSRGLYIVAKGRVRVSRLSQQGREQTLAIAEPFQTLGEAALFSEPPRHGNHAVCLQPSTVICLPTALVRRLSLEHPALSQAMLKEFSRRIQQLEERLEEQALMSLEQRLARSLLEGGREDWSVTELASFLGVARETLSRLVQRWIREGVLERRGSQVRVLDRQALSRISAAPSITAGHARSR